MIVSHVQRRPLVGTVGEPLADRRFAGEGWSKDPHFEALAKTYLQQTELMRQALDAAPLDERSKAQWRFALGQVTDALSPTNMLATNPADAAVRAMPSTSRRATTRWPGESGVEIGR